MPKLDPRQIIDIRNDPALSKVRIDQKHDAHPQQNTKIPKYHWTKDKIDKRDYLYKPTAIRMPSAVDLRSFCSPIEDQGYLGSCTGQAIAGAIELLNKRNRKPTDVSRLFIYYYERLMLGTVHYDSGAYIRDGIKVTNKQGAPLEMFWPYIINKYKQQPSSQSVIDALKRRVTLYERAVNFNSCINAIASGYPVTIGFSVYESFESNTVSRTGIMPYPNVRNEALLGGHAVLLVGYDNFNQRFIARNSWGPNWGDKGYFYMPYKVIQNPTMSSDFWIIKSVNNP